VALVPKDPRPDWRLITKHTTPLSILVYVINKKSQNHYAEQVLNMIGAEKRNQGSWEAGGGEAKELAETKQEILADYVPVGTRTFKVKDTSAYKVGDTLMVGRGGNQEWINTIGMQKVNTWDPFTMKFQRVVQQVTRDSVTVDAPIVNAIDRRWGGGSLVRYEWPERIENVGVEGIRYVGNHGLELDERAAELADRIAAFRDSVALPVEDKGLSLSYHYRGAEDEETAKARLEEVAGLARAEGLDPRWGRKVLEIRPPVAADKGTAVTALLASGPSRNGLYGGADTTDLDGFEGRRRAGLDHAVRVAVASEEGPAELPRAADLVVQGPAQLASLLATL
jgi:trehalose 6-phosphate phosphatase